MKKTAKFLFAFAVVAVVLGAFAGCKTSKSVTDTEILIGNTVPVGGAMGFIGQPFQAALEVVLRKANAENEGKGIGGRQIRLINRDDGGVDATVSQANTKALVEEDQVFAIVGHFGVAVDPTVQYLTEKNVPMFYAANGTNKLYQEAAPGNPILPVQPIGMTDGRVMLARALSNPVYGPNKNAPLNRKTAKVGILHTSDQGALDMLAGINREAEILGVPAENLLKQEFVYTDASSVTSAVSALLSKNPDVILLPLSQNPFKAIIPELIKQENTANAYSSYFNADATAVPDGTNPKFNIYVNAWLDITSTSGGAEAAEFVATIMNDPVLSDEEKKAYSGSAFAMAGYVCGTMFVDVVKRLGDIKTSDFTTKAFVDAAELKPVHIPMGGDMDFSNGQRLGITHLALLQYIPAQGATKAAFGKALELTSLEDLESQILGK